MEGGKLRSDLIYRESDSILGKLYRSVDCKTLFKKCIENDHARSICLDYNISKYILGDEKNLK
jgi:hypothetical protein